MHTAHMALMLMHDCAQLVRKLHTLLTDTRHIMMHVSAQCANARWLQKRHFVQHLRPWLLKRQVELTPHVVQRVNEMVHHLVVM